MNNYRGEYDETEHDQDWYALSNRREYNQRMYGSDYRSRDPYGYDYDTDNYGFDRYDSGEDT